MEIALAGKTNVGKTTFFAASTLVDAEISNRTFTTIKPNIGISYVVIDCVCKEFNTDCKKCINGKRPVPIKLVDIAGLVPDAHLGKGLGNQFLSDIMQCDALIHVIDISGSTDIHGNQCSPGSHNPKEDIDFFEKEIDYWLLGILKKNWDKIRKEQNFYDGLYKALSGLKISEDKTKSLTEKFSVNRDSSDEVLLNLVKEIRKETKPMIIAANKIDIPEAQEILNKVKNDISYRIVPCSADSELALRKATKLGLVDYNPGENEFKIKENVDERKKNALEKIRKNILDKYGSTGVQKCLDSAVFDLLDMIVVFPVENIEKFSDKQGNVLPDALLIRKGSTALDLAYKIHEDIGKKFIAATDVRTHKNVSAKHELKHRDVISIKAGR